MKIIDSHVHLSSNSYSNLISSESENILFRMENSIENFIRIMDKHKIDKSIVFSIPHTDIDVDASNDYILNAYKKYPDRFIPFCRLNEKLEENIKAGFKGAKLHLLYEKLDIENLKSYFEILEYYKRPITIHALFKNKVEQIKKILEYAPKLNIILAHMGRKELYTNNGVLEVLEGLKQYINVYFDTSTVGDSSIIEKGVNIVGNERIIYGSDFPFGEVWSREKNENHYYNDELSLIINSKLNFKEKENILSRNISNLLNL